MPEERGVRDEKLHEEQHGPRVDADGDTAEPTSQGDVLVRQEAVGGLGVGGEERKDDAGQSARAAVPSGGERGRDDRQAAGESGASTCTARASMRPWRNSLRRCRA